MDGKLFMLVHQWSLRLRLNVLCRFCAWSSWWYYIDPYYLWREWEMEISDCVVQINLIGWYLYRLLFAFERFTWILMVLLCLESMIIQDERIRLHCLRYFIDGLFIIIVELIILIWIYSYFEWILLADTICINDIESNLFDWSFPNYCCTTNVEIYSGNIMKFI